MSDESKPSPKSVEEVHSWYDKIALPLGHLCIVWAHIEEEINYYLRFLIPLEIGKVELCLTTNIDFREKIQIVKALAFLRKPDNSWYDTLVGQLDLLDNDYRVRRNRYIHDLILLESNEPAFSRVTGGVKVVKPKAFQKTLSTPDFVHIDADEIIELYKKLDECRDKLVTILYQYRQHLSSQ